MNPTANRTETQMNSNINSHDVKELDARENDGLEVRLLWQRGDNAVVVEVNDTKLDDHFRLTVPGDHALDAFHHPYAYAALRPLELHEELVESAHA
jgi:hypothetical protein